MITFLIVSPSLSLLLIIHRSLCNNPSIFQQQKRWLQQCPPWHLYLLFLNLPDYHCYVNYLFKTTVNLSWHFYLHYHIKFTSIQILQHSFTPQIISYIILSITILFHYCNHKHFYSHQYQPRHLSFPIQSSKHISLLFLIITDIYLHIFPSIRHSIHPKTVIFKTSIPNNIIITKYQHIYLQPLHYPLSLCYSIYILHSHINLLHTLILLESSLEQLFLLIKYLCLF